MLSLINISVYAAKEEMKEADSEKATMKSETMESESMKSEMMKSEMMKSEMMKSEMMKSEMMESESMKSDPMKPASDTDDMTSTSADKDEHDHNHEIIINPPMDAFKQQQQDIKRYINSEEMETLLVGQDEFLILTDKHASAVNKGVMILIPDWQQSATRSNAIKQLRENMPNKGWTTLTLHPPHHTGHYPSQALEKEMRLKENTESLTTYKKTLSTVMAEVLKKAKSYPGTILIVAQGQHAALIIDSVQNKLIAAPTALVMLSSYMPTIAESHKLAKQVAMTNYPALDLYLKHDNRWVLTNTKRRKDFAKNEMKVSYRQKQLSNRITGYYPKQTLTREIIGWLKSEGW